MMAILPRRSHGGENLAGTFCQKKVDRDNCFVSRKVSAYVEINPGGYAPSQSTYKNWNPYLENKPVFLRQSDIGQLGL